MSFIDDARAWRLRHAYHDRAMSLLLGINTEDAEELFQGKKRWPERAQRLMQDLISDDLPEKPQS